MRVGQHDPLDPVRRGGGDRLQVRVDPRGLGPPPRRPRRSCWSRRGERRRVVRAHPDDARSDRCRDAPRAGFYSSRVAAVRLCSAGVAVSRTARRVPRTRRGTLALALGVMPRCAAVDAALGGSGRARRAGARRTADRIDATQPPRNGVRGGARPRDLHPAGRGERRLRRPRARDRDLRRGARRRPRRGDSPPLRTAREVDAAHLQAQYRTARVLGAESLEDAGRDLLAAIGRPLGWQFGQLWEVVGNESSSASPLGALRA